MAESAVSYLEWKKRLEGVPLPALILDEEAFLRNIEKVLRKLEKGNGPKTLRVATKSVRCVEILKRLLHRSEKIQGLMTYRARETELLAAQGFDDFLLAYPEVEKEAIQSMLRVHLNGKKIRAVVDSLEGVKRIASQIESENEKTKALLEARPFEVVLEIDLSLKLFLGLFSIGAKRSPVRTCKELVALAKAANSFSGIRVSGIMGYESQVAGVQDASPFKKFLNPIKRWIRKRSATQIYRLRNEVSQALKDSEVSYDLFNGGGSGSLEWTLKEPWLTEVTAGSAFFGSHLFSCYSNQSGDDSFEPALFMAIRCVRKPSPDVATCFGGGIIASGEPGWDKVPIPFLPQGATLDSMEGCGEVQTPVHLKNTQEVQIGDPILFRTAKSGEPLESFDRLWVMKKSGSMMSFPTYRFLESSN